MKRALWTSLVLALLLSFASTLFAYDCVNNPGCRCFDQTYRGGDDCVSTGDDCLTIICL